MKLTKNQWIGVASICATLAVGAFGLLKKDIAQTHYGSGDNVAGDKITTIESTFAPILDVSVSIPSYKIDNGLYRTKFYIKVPFLGKQVGAIVPSRSVVSCENQKYEGGQTIYSAGVESGTYDYTIECTSLKPIQTTEGLFTVNLNE
jgi:ABC-type cobalt transport system substrate-binding protein